MNITMDIQTRAEALLQAFKSIEATHGKGSVMKMGGGQLMQVESIPTGSLALDLALGCGGYPRGRLVEIFGPEASGKTTLALHAIASVQKEGGTAAFIDAEHALDPTYAKALGVNVDELVISQPDCGEQALEIAETLVRSGAVEIVVIDSVAALVPRIELDGGMEDIQVGLQARMMSKAMRKLANVVSKSNSILIFINQVRSKIGVTFGSNETTTGGRALRYFTSVRIDIRRIGALKEGENIIGNRTKIKVVKNKLAPPFKELELDLIYGKGISAMGDLIDLALERGIIKRSGAYYSFGDERVGRGREAVRERLQADQELRQQVQALVLTPSAES